MKHLSVSLVCIVVVIFTIVVLSWTSLLVEASPAGQQPGYITTVAGNGQSAHGGDNGLATDASFAWVAAVVETKNGDVYISDSNAHVVRKITKSTGIITTIAGTPNQFGFSGDGGQATSAKLKNPRGLYFDELSGSLYIADSNNCVRMVDSQGMISTVAGNGVMGFSGDGGLATAASLSSPQGITGNDKGELLIADTGNNRIRKVGVDKMISTIAGKGNYADFIEGEEATKSPLIGPTSLAFNDEGELLFVSEDSSGARFVLKIGIDGRIEKVASNGVNGFAGDGGPAVDASFGDASNFISYISIAIGKGGEVYIADRYNSRIRMINSAGIISTIAGDGQKRYAGDGGPAIEASFTVPYYVSVAPNGDIYVGDYSRVRVIYASSMSCFGLSSEDPNVCSGHGSCAVDQCKCREGWMGIDCSITHCFGFTSNLPDRVCSGRGECVKPDECHCNSGHRGHKCQRT